jgi:hypothetical protein
MDERPAGNMISGPLQTRLVDMNPLDPRSTLLSEIFYGLVWFEFIARAAVNSANGPANGDYLHKENISQLLPSASYLPQCNKSNNGTKKNKYGKQERNTTVWLWNYYRYQMVMFCK